MQGFFITMIQEPLPPELTKLEYYKPEQMLEYAFDIKKGRAGGDYFYSLEEDYIYVYEEGYWKKIKDKQFQHRIEKGMGVLTTLTIQKRREVIENFKVKRHLSIEELNTSNLINFQNCMFDTTIYKDYPHSKDYYSTLRIPYNYDPEAKCHLWEKTLNEIFQNNSYKIKTLQEFLGYCVSSDNEQKKALLLLGDTNTGKSTIIDISREIIGEYNCSNVPLQYLSNPQYTPLLINKMVNIDPEINKEAVNYEREFKLLTGGKKERVTCNQKHIPTFEFVPRCKLLLSANEFPRIKDHSSAFYQRLLLIPCERRFKEEEKNRNLDDELRKELPGIFNWVIEGLKRLKERGKFEHPDFMKDAVEELENENNPAYVFFNDHVEIDLADEIYIEKSILFERYKEWCRGNEQYNLTHIQFSQCVIKKFGMVTPKNARLQGNGARIWKNLRYVNFKNERRTYATSEEE